MKLSDLKRPLKEFSSGGAVGGGAVASTAGGLGNVAPTVKAQKKKRKLRNGQSVLAREARETVDAIWKRGYHEGQDAGFQDGKKDLSTKDFKFTEPHDPFKRGRVTRANAYEKSYQAGYQDGYHDAITGGVH